MQDLELGFRSSGFRVPGSGFRVQGPGFAFEGSEFKKISGAVALDFSTNKRLPAGAAGGFTRPSEIHFCGLPRLDRPLRRLASTLFYLVSKNVLEGFKTLQRRRGDLFKIALSKAPENSFRRHP